MVLTFETQYQRIFDPDKRRRFAANPGSGVVKEYTAQYRQDGVLELVETGAPDLYADIQSHKDSCDLQLIINLYFNGDPAALSRVQGVYMDVSEMPDNIHQAMQLMDNARRDFDTLPVDIKAKFGNDPNQFLATLGTEQWFANMQIAQDGSAGSAKASEQNEQKDGDAE